MLLGASQLVKSFCEEVPRHGSWLRNRLSADIGEGRISILEWKPSTRITFEGLQSFGDRGFTFQYISPTMPRSKLEARSIPGHFSGVHHDESLFRIYLPRTNNIIMVGSRDFGSIENLSLPR